MVQGEECNYGKATLQVQPLLFRQSRHDPGISCLADLIQLRTESWSGVLIYIAMQPSKPQ